MCTGLERESALMTTAGLARPAGRNLLRTKSRSRWSGSDQGRAQFRKEIRRRVRKFTVHPPNLKALQGRHRMRRNTDQASQFARWAAFASSCAVERREQVIDRNDT